MKKKLALFSAMIFSVINLVGMQRNKQEVAEPKNLSEQIKELRLKKEQTHSLWMLGRSSDQKNMRTSVTLKQLADNTAKECIDLLSSAGNKKLQESRETPTESLLNLQQEYLDKWKKNLNDEQEGFSSRIIKLFFNTYLPSKLEQEINILESKIIALEKQKEEEEVCELMQRLFDTEA